MGNPVPVKVRAGLPDRLIPLTRVAKDPGLHRLDEALRDALVIFGKIDSLAQLSAVFPDEPHLDARIA